MQIAQVEFETHEQALVAACTGEIDQSNANALSESLALGVPSDAVALVLDLSSVGYLDSAGIQMIYELRSRLTTRGQELRLVIPEASASQTALRLAGVDRHIDIFRTRAEALAP